MHDNGLDQRLIVTYSMKPFGLNTTKAASEEVFDDFYTLCTNLDDAVQEIVKVNQRRWEMEECFRIMKTECKAHFTTCFLALIVYRYVEKKLDYKYTIAEIISGLKEMNFYEIPGVGYVPTYTRTDFTDALHDAFGFHTDLEIVSKQAMKKILKGIKM